MLTLLLSSAHALLLLPVPRAATHHAHRHGSVVASGGFVAAATAAASPSVVSLITGACACAVRVGEETLLLTSNSGAGNGTSILLDLDADGSSQRLEAAVVGRLPEADLALLQLPTGVAPPPALSFSDDTNLCEGDFVVAVNAKRKAALGMLTTRSQLPGFVPTREARAPPAGTAEAALAQAEAEAEAEAEAAGESPCLVCTGAPADGMIGGPLLDDQGQLVGVTTLVLTLGDTTRYYAVAARRAQRAVGSMAERRALGEQVRGVRVVLRNDNANKRERVAQVLAMAGLSEQAASFAMLAAHSTGRGVVGYFASEAEAESLRATLSAADKKSQDGWPSFAEDLTFETEPCDYYRQQPEGAEGAEGAQPAASG